MSERTRQDLDALREGLLLVEEWRKTHEDRARMAGVEANAEMERRKAGAYAAVAALVRRELEAPAAGEAVRERVAREIREAAWADPTGLRERQNAEALADRILALLRAPRGEGEAEPLAWRVEYRGRTGGEWEYLNTYDLVEVAKEKVERMRRGGVPLEYRIVPLYPAALRSEANGKEADALDLIRWAESQGAVLEPVAGNLTPPGTYACYVEGVGDDPAEYEDAGEPYMGPGILGAIRAARRGEGGGDAK